MSKWTRHPFSGIYGDRDKGSRDSLLAQLRTGQQMPITAIGSQILDGWQRLQILQEIGVEPKIVQYRGGKSDAELMAAVISLNGGRDLSESQRAMIAAESVGHLGKDMTVEAVATLFNASRRNVFHAQTVLKRSKKMAARVKAGELNLNAAITQLDHKSREQAVEQLRLDAKVTIKDCDLRHGDNVKLMRSMDAGCARTIFCDPPYNCSWRYRADPTKDRVPDAQYFDLCRTWMSEAARLLAPDGSLFVLIDDNYTDHFGLLLRETGLHRQHTIIQFDTFAEYNSAETSLSQNARYLHWFTKAEQPFINKVEARVQSERQIIKDKRGNAIGRLPPNVWPFVRVTSKSKERCPWLGKEEEAPQLPRELPERCILLTSEPGDLVIDPFNGNGISGIAALTNDRKYIGIDRDKKGLEQSRSWIAHEYKRLKELK